MSALIGVLVAAGLSVVLSAPAQAAPCDAPVVSPVACENTRAGSPESEWGITGAGSASIQGFATQMSVNVGETEGFKIDTPATSYRLDIYRMGYYGGLGARKVATVNPTSINTNQPNCVTNAGTGLVDCGNWTQNASWTVPSDAVSGIYFAKLVRTDGPAGSSHVFFVVRNDDARSQLLFQTSDTTWQAYNAYGGNSLYTGSPAGRAYKVSYNRPFTTRDNAPEDFVFNSEYPMVRWLESNGYDVSYTSGVDTDRRGAELLEHRVFMSVGHDEYWSGQQRANVEAARAAGVHLAFFSGNEIFWKTRWENSIDGAGTPYRTLVTYKETHADARIDPQDPPIWTGTWRDPRFSPPADGGRPENALSGTIFTSNCCAINMIVSSADGKMRFWRNTRVATLGTNQTTTVGTNVIGYEWDEDADNGARPPGLFRLSQTTGNAQVLQDWGSNYADGTATHSMTMYRASSGALVFGAGTIQWPWALDASHDRGSAAADTAARQATVNLFADMGVQPTTLQSGLTAAVASTDTAAPTSTITAPANNATVPLGNPLTISGTAADAGGGQVGGVEVSADDGVTWRRATGRQTWTYTFTPTTDATLKIRSRAADDSGNIENPKPAITVTAGTGSGGGSGSCPCTIWPSSAVPQKTDPDTSPVELGVRFRPSQNGFVTGIRYYKPTQAAGTHVGTLWTGTGTKLATATFTNETASGWQQANFSSPVPVTANTTYVASYFAPSRYAVSSAYFTAAFSRGPLTALANGTDGGNGLYRYGSTAGSFPTSTYNSENYWVDVVYDNGPDTTKPTLTGRTPATGATNVATNVAPTATFSEAVNAGSITFQLRTASGTQVTATTGYNAGTQTATLTPAAPLAAGTTYTATVSGAADAAGNVMDPVTWTFTTVAPDTAKPTVTARTPAAGASGVALGVAPAATFSEPVTAASVTFQVRNPAGTLVAGSTAYNAGSQTATFTPTAPLQASTTYTVSVSGATDSAGNVMDAVTWTFTTVAADTTKPTVTARNPATGATGVPTSVAPAATFSEPVTAASVTFQLRNPAGTLVAGSTAYNAGSQTATFTPTAPLQASTTYTVSVSGATDSAGNVMDAVTWTFTTAASTSPCPCTIWAPTATPATTDPDASSVELGVRFRAAQDGFITGIRYYKPTATSGTHVGSLWTSTGTRLATVNFTGESASGWQQATFPSPVPVTANTTYVASYFTPTRYAVSSAYFAAAATTRGPLTALRDGTDGGNGLYRYTSTPSVFPNGTYNSENYWVDVVFQESAADTTAPSLQDRTPAANATGASTNTTITATYNEAIQAGSPTVELRNPAGTLLAGTITIDTSGTRVVFQPASALQASTTYSVQVSGARDASGNTAATTSWTFQTAAPAPPPPDQGPGGPIAVVTSASNPVSTYLAEILRAEGLNEFTTIGPAGLTAANLASFGALVIGQVPVTDAQVAAVTDWVNAGGDLVLMRPDSRLLPLAGLTAQSGTVSEGYVAVDGATPPGAGITTESMQFHGTADRYALNGATTVATLFTTATASTGQPAVSWRSVGSNGGQVATFSYDLARSIVQTHQGNPAWAGQDRDGQAPIRSDDLYFGGSQANWVNLAKVHIPQADEQQRLLANLITVMRRDQMPMPRFWYFPDALKAVVVATGDDHGTGGTAGRFDTYLSASPAGCSVAAWTCPRFTSYVYTSTPLSNAQASSYNGQGFEVGLHHSTDCGDFTSLSSLQSGYSSQLASWRAKYSSLPAPVTNRTHCIVFSDWSSQPRAELANGIRLDTNYYFWPGSWVGDRPGFMNGSGIPMRFTDTDGSMIDVYQTQTVMTDESEQSYPFTPNTLFDRALGPLGYYGAFTANVHTDSATTFESSALLDAAQARGVPIVTARQMLTWVDGRNGSSFGNLSWTGSTLSFSISVGTGASRLSAMLPTSGPGGTSLTAVARGGTAVAFTPMTIKGQEYAVFPASAGAWTATYGAGSGASGASLAVTAARVADAPGAATVSWSTTRPSTSVVRFGTKAGSLMRVTSTAESTTRHRISLDGLSPGTTYHYRIVTRTPDGATRMWPSRERPPATFRTARADARAPAPGRVRMVSLPDGTARVTWRTSEPSASEVWYAGGDGAARTRRDDQLVRNHEIVLTGLRSRAAYRVVVVSTDEAGNRGRSRPATLRTRAAGVAIQTSADLRNGRTRGDLRVSDRGLGALVLPDGGSGRYVSDVLDARAKVHWATAVIAHSRTPGARWILSVRTGSRAVPDGSWSGWHRVRGSKVPGAGRYLQFRLRLVAPLGTRSSVAAVGFTHDGSLPVPVGELRRR